MKEERGFIAITAKEHVKSKTEKEADVDGAGGVHHEMDGQGGCEPCERAAQGAGPRPTKAKEALWGGGEKRNTAQAIT